MVDMRDFLRKRDSSNKLLRYYKDKETAKLDEMWVYIVGTDFSTHDLCTTMDQLGGVYVYTDFDVAVDSILKMGILGLDEKYLKRMNLGYFSIRELRERIFETRDNFDLKLMAPYADDKIMRMEIRYNKVNAEET